MALEVVAFRVVVNTEIRNRKYLKSLTKIYQNTWNFKIYAYYHITKSRIYNTSIDYELLNFNDKEFWTIN